MSYELQLTTLIGLVTDILRAVQTALSMFGVVFLFNVWVKSKKEK